MKADPELGRAAALRKRDAGLNERQIQPAERLPGILAPIFHHRRGRGEMSCSAGMLRALRSGVLLSIIDCPLSLTVVPAQATDLELPMRKSSKRCLAGPFHWPTFFPR